METKDLEKRFKSHPVNDEGLKDLEDVRIACLSAAFVINKLAPEGREKSLAITHLEEAMFWANAGIARSEVSALH